MRSVDFIGQRGFRSMFEVLGALLFIGLQQPLLALVSFAITPALSRLLRSVVVRSSAIIYRRQQVHIGARVWGAQHCAGWHAPSSVPLQPMQHSWHHAK